MIPGHGPGPAGAGGQRGPQERLGRDPYSEDTAGNNGGRASIGIPTSISGYH